MKSFSPKPWFAPQPVLIIGTYNKDGVANAMNAAWAGQWDMKEIMISMGNHVTTDNLKLGGEFTVAFATKKTMVASDFVGIVSAKNDPKKMEKTGWSIEKATMVNAPVFTDFPMTLECRIKEKYDESETGYYLIAEIVNILVDEKYLAEDGNPDMEKMELIVFDPIHHGYIQLGEKVGNAFSDGIAGFTIPLCATIHLSGSMMKITCCALTICLINGLPCNLPLFLNFIFVLAICMVAAPGVPGGAVMAALGPLASVLGFNADMQALMIALYIAMDSFGTACNVTGDGAIAVVVDKIFRKDK